MSFYATFLLTMYLPMRAGRVTVTRQISGPGPPTWWENAHPMIQWAQATR